MIVSSVTYQVNPYFCHLEGRSQITQQEET